MCEVAAFFDIDGTLYRENMQTELFKRLIRYNIIHSSEWHNELEPYYKRWDNRIGNYDDYVENMSLIYRKSIRGLSKSVLEFIAKQVIDEKGGRVYTYTRSRILWHKEQGHKIITISGSPIELVSHISKMYGFDEYRGTFYVTDSYGNYTGELLPLWDRDNKQKALTELIETHNLDLSKCYAYGDTAGDLSMLTQVGNPTCINPNKELVQNIKSNPELMKKINVIIERKDVIYNVDLENCKLII